MKTLNFNIIKDADKNYILNSIKLFKNNKSLFTSLYHCTKPSDYIEFRGLFERMIFNNEISAGAQTVLNSVGLLYQMPTDRIINGAATNYYPDYYFFDKFNKTNLLEFFWDKYTIEFRTRLIDEILISSYGGRVLRDELTSSIKKSTFFIDNDYVFVGNPDTRMIGSLLKPHFDICEKLMNTINTNYDPTKPFNITLDETLNETGSGSNNRTVNLRDQNNTSTEHNVNNDTTTDEVENNIYSFNQTEQKVAKDRNTSSHRLQDITIYDDTLQKSGTDQYSTSRSAVNTRNYTRSGNIGNQSYSKLIEDERKKIMFDFRQYIIDGIVDVLCTGTWSD